MKNNRDHNYSNSRRDFLKKSGLVVAGGLLVPAFLKSQSISPEVANGRNLVVIQLSGGNDGLNTFIPYRNDIYYASRPKIAIEANKVLKLTDELGLNPAMKGLKKLYDEGDVCIINNVGYPNPNRSHFLSMDIWHTALGRNDHTSSGWLGRYLDHECQNMPPHTAIETSDILSLALKGNKSKGLPIANPWKFYTASKGVDVKNKPQSVSNDAVNFLYKTIAETKESANYIFHKSKVFKSKKEYPKGALGNNLKHISKFINSGLDTRVYYASLGGFDTHNNQLGRQENLLI